jgi:hypothetical protein
VESVPARPDRRTFFRMTLLLQIVAGATAFHVVNP